MSSIYCGPGIALAALTKAVSSVVDGGGRHQLVLPSKTATGILVSLPSEFGLMMLNLSFLYCSPVTSGLLWVPLLEWPIAKDRSQILFHLSLPLGFPTWDSLRQI